MKKEEKKPFIQCSILGAIGVILMAAGDWLLGCVPLQKTDTGMFNRACYLSGAYALWKLASVVGMGALGCFLYSFMVKALNTDIDARYTRTKAIQYFCGLFTVVVALAIHLWAAICLLCRTPVSSRTFGFGASLGRRAFFRLCDRRVLVGLTFFLQGLSHCSFHDDFTLRFRRHFLCHGFTVSLVLLRLRDNASLKALICSSTEC